MGFKRCLVALAMALALAPLAPSALAQSAGQLVINFSDPLDSGLVWWVNVWSVEGSVSESVSVTGLVDVAALDLPPGEYWVSASSGLSTDFAPQIYHPQTHLVEERAPVTVVADTQTTIELEGWQNPRVEVIGEAPYDPFMDSWVMRAELFEGDSFVKDVYMYDEDPDKTMILTRPATFTARFSGEAIITYVGHDFVTTWYQDAPDQTSAAEVTVSWNETVELHQPLKLEAWISGAVRSWASQGIDAVVEVYDSESLSLVWSGRGAAVNGNEFATPVLPPGDYLVLGSIPSATGDASIWYGYFPTWYGGAPLYRHDLATPVTVDSGRAGNVVIELVPFYTDMFDTVFVNDIAWMHLTGLTVGCGNDRYCTDAPVTRAQMATFLVRALGLSPSDGDHFGDDDLSVHERDINALFEAGITVGCGEGMFCPERSVTRGEMATFLVRALKLDPTSDDFFVDDDSNVHEGSINALRLAGITYGCGADEFCPFDSVTRGQMAAFLRRALSEPDAASQSLDLHSTSAGQLTQGGWSLVPSE